MRFILSGRTTVINDFLSGSPFNKNFLFLTLLLSKGAFSIRDSHLRFIVKQNVDVSILGAPYSNKNEINNYINRINEISEIPKEIYKNNEFYKFIFLELCAFFIYQSKKQGIVAFLHAYRILEKIAYAFPLIYIRNTVEFDKTFSDLKKFFLSSNNNSGELLFFKTALNNLLDAQENSYIFTVNIDNAEKKGLSLCLSPYTAREVNDGIEIDMNLIEYVNFFVNIRNKFFHALSGKDHFSLDTLMRPEITLLKINKHIINILCFIIGKFSEPTVLQNE